MRRSLVSLLSCALIASVLVILPGTPSGAAPDSCTGSPDPFLDVPLSSFAREDITCIFNLEVTTGTSATTYSPNDFVTREQMASFLARMYKVLNGGEAAPVVATPFTDVSATSFARDDIARIFGLGITTGTSATTYSPSDLVTREQMAAFLARLYEALKGEAAPIVSTPFTDVPATSFARDAIAQIFGLEITTGTSATTYSPGNFVTREQMAAFLARLYASLEDLLDPPDPDPEPPVLSTIADQSASEGDIISVIPSGTNVTTWSATGLPDGLGINTATGAISGTIAVGAAAMSPYTVTVTGTNADGTDSETFTFTVDGTVFVSDLTVPTVLDTTSYSGFGPIELDQSNGEDSAGDGAPLTIEGSVFQKGLGMHSSASETGVDVNLNGECTRFQASVGIDDEVDVLGSVNFIVDLDGVNEFTSAAPMTGIDDPEVLDIDVTGVDVLSLNIDNGGDDNAFDHANWGNARLTCTGLSGATGNQAPVIGLPLGNDFINGGGRITLNEGQTTNVMPRSVDPNGDGLSFAEVGSNLPTGLTLDPDTGAIEGQVGNSAAGSYTVTVEVTDDGTGALTDTVAIDIVVRSLAGANHWVSDLQSDNEPLDTDPTINIVNNDFAPPEFDTSIGLGPETQGDGTPLQIGSSFFAKGLGVHAESEIAIGVGGDCSSFAATVGIDQESPGSAGATFRVLVDGVEEATQTVADNGASFSISVSLVGHSEVTLIVDGDGDPEGDHADWADARLICGGPGNTAPVITEIPDPASNWDEGVAIPSIQVVASDIDGDALTFDPLTGGPTGVTISAGGLISGTPGGGEAGSYPAVTVTVDDGTTTSTESFAVTVDP